MKTLFIFTTILLLASIWSLSQVEPEPISPHIPNSFEEMIQTPVITVTPYFPTPFIATMNVPFTIPTHATIAQNEVNHYGYITDSILWAVRRMARLHH